MLKILLAIDAQNIKTSTIDFACYLAALTRSKLTGVFLEDLLFKEVNQLFGVSSYNKEFQSLEEIKKTTEERIVFFREACEKRGVQAIVHRKRKIPLEEMIEESRFADLIIVDPEITFNSKMESAPTTFVKDLLKESECPVFLAPDNFEAIDEIVFAYDANYSSVLSIRQFTYLFPELGDKKITVLAVNEGNEPEIKSKNKLSEWLKTHYRELDYHVVGGDPESELLKYLIGKDNLFIVMGSFGRSTLSLFFKPSHATFLVRTTNFPIFITHP